jgi:hypothetical protein
MPATKKRSLKSKSADANTVARNFMLRSEYSRAIGRARSTKGAINAKKKRTKMIREIEALGRDDGFAWLELSRKKRRVSRPLKAIAKAREALSRSSGKGKGKKTDTDKLAALLETLEEAVKPLLVETQKYIEAAKTNKDRLDTMTKRGLDVDRAVLDACGDVLDMHPNFFYATPEVMRTILPASVFQTTEMHRSANQIGKAMSKNEAQGKRHATMGRQDIPDSIVPHRPECVGGGKEGGNRKREKGPLN